MSDQPIENSFEDFTERYDKLNEEAHQYGISMVVILFENDPLSSGTTTWIDWKGGLPLCIGLAENAKHKLLKVSLADEDDDD